MKKANASVVVEVASWNNNCIFPPEDGEQGPKQVAANYIKNKIKNTLKKIVGKDGFLLLTLIKYEHVRSMGVLQQLHEDLLAF
jgi:hypothetical protein